VGGVLEVVWCACWMKEVSELRCWRGRDDGVTCVGAVEARVRLRDAQARRQQHSSTAEEKPRQRSTREKKKQ
jgi:hypothetical protein